MQSLKDPHELTPVVTVSELTAQIKDQLENRFDHLAVVGEVSNAKIYPSGHWYFSLKDKEATLLAICFKYDNLKVRFALEDGLMVVARGKLSVWPPRGNYQMVVSTLEPVGIGEWQLAFDQLKEKLEKEGLLALERKRPIPSMPRKIGVVTSEAGAALHDIITALKRRNQNVHVVIRGAKVQGEGSAEDIANGILDLQTIHDIEVIIVARGGGSIEDLWSFNTEIVARAVATCRVPVVSGVGHETDTTICDLVSDLRAPTPTAAAELVARRHAELGNRFLHLYQRLNMQMSHLMNDVKWRAQKLDPVRSLSYYQERLKASSNRIDSLQQRIWRDLTSLIAKSSFRSQQCREKLLSLGPKNVLKRGFAIVQKPDGTVIKKASDVLPSEQLEVILAEGKLTVWVTNVSKNNKEI